MNRILIAVAVFLLPLSANAGVMTDKMAQACKASAAGCQAYTLGGADRYWLVSGKHESCDVANDKKTQDAVKKAISGTGSIYNAKPVQPAVSALLTHLNKNKLQSCALTSNFTDLTALCVAKDEAHQTNCHAYIAGVVDMAVEMDKQNQQTKKGTYKTPFCDNGKPKIQMSDAEIMQAITEFGQSSVANAEGNVPAAQVVMQALLTKYSCKNATNTSSSDKAADKTEKSSDKTEKSDKSSKPEKSDKDKADKSADKK